MIEKKTFFTKRISTIVKEATIESYKTPIVIIYYHSTINKKRSFSIIYPPKKKNKKEMISTFRDSIDGDKYPIRRLLNILFQIEKNLMRNISSKNNYTLDSTIAKFIINRRRYYACAINIKPLGTIDKSLYDFLMHISDKNLAETFLLFLQKKNHFGLIILPITREKTSIISSVINPLMSIYSNSHSIQIDFINRAFIKNIILKIILAGAIKGFASKIKNKKDLDTFLIDFSDTYIQHKILSENIGSKLTTVPSKQNDKNCYYLLSTISEQLSKKAIKIIEVNSPRTEDMSYDTRPEEKFVTLLKPKSHNLWALVDYFQYFEEFFLPEALYLSTILKNKKDETESPMTSVIKNAQVKS
ncbi:MAG: hypothetical protein Q6363_005465 [Candidatus Njordarchaeota archaeon]